MSTVVCAFLCGYLHCRSAVGARHAGEYRVRPRGGLQHGGKCVDFTKTANWLQVTANLGIVAGLILVGVQLQQNTDLLKTQLLYEESRLRVRTESGFMFGNRYATAWWKKFSEDGGSFPQDVIDEVDSRLK